MKKIIKKSNRGLTFSFDGENTKFNIGNKYRYIVDPKNNKVFIIPTDSDTSLKVSRKKVGNKVKSLIDLRAKLVLNNFQDADLIEVKIEKDSIIIEGLKEVTSCTSNKRINSARKSSKIIELDKKKSKYKKVKEIKIDKQLFNKISGDSINIPLDSILSTLYEDEFNTSTNQRESLSEGLNVTIKVLSVFSGAGMFDYPLFEDEKFEIIKAIEINKAACETYKKNIGDIIINENIENFNLDDDNNEYDVLYGGITCKPYSNANRNNRLENHEDINLIDEYIRILKSHKYFKAFVIENVPQLLTANNGEYLENLKRDLDDFEINHIILQDNECGGYTKRKRAFIFGSKIGKVSLAYVKKLGRTVGNALKKVTNKWFNYNDITSVNNSTKERMKFVPPGGNWQDIPKELWLPSYNIGKTHSNTYRRLDINAPSITLANYRKCNIIHPIEDRGLSVAEAAAISGFNDYKFMGSLSEKQQAVANGVPYHLGLTVKNILKRLFMRYFNNNIVYD